jgi:UDP-N-acetylmuramoyl-tripeptide--D-alanyl-D-alanine ligase
MMRAFALQEAVRMMDADAGTVAGTFQGVSTDTRTLQAGDLFVALRGDRFDGHAYVAEAADAGAAGAVVDILQQAVSLPQLQVNDTLTALAKLARGNRQESTARVAAITGSSGKTTVKEMLAAILRQEGETLATEGNLNNHIGAPLTLLRLAPEHRYAVIELGASGVGEIAYTVDLVQPEVAVITNAGEAHIEGFGSYENIVRAKGEIIDGVPSDGTVVLNGDDPAVDTWIRRADGRCVVLVSQDNASSDFHERQVQQSATHQTFVAESAQGNSLTITLSLPGGHNRLNALMAIAAARELGASDQAIQQGLATLKPVKGRLQPMTLKSGVELIDDSYNANPTSMQAAFRLLAQHAGTRIAVLGHMAELGDQATLHHERCGRLAADLGIEYLLAVGENTEGYVQGFGENALHCATHDEATNWLISHLPASATLLIKGSRSSAMDAVVRALQDKVKN